MTWIEVGREDRMKAYCVLGQMLSDPKARILAQSSYGIVVQNEIGTLSLTANAIYWKEGTRNMKMEFGKHKGQELEEIERYDPSYLDWLLDQPWIRDDLRGTIEKLRGDENDSFSIGYEGDDVPF